MKIVFKLLLCFMVLFSCNKQVGRPGVLDLSEDSKNKLSKEECGIVRLKMSQIGLLYTHISSTEKIHHRITFNDIATCIIDDIGKIICWDSLWSCAPIRFKFEEKWGYLAMGLVHFCALNDNDDLYCWGGNSHGQLGIGSFGKWEDPTKVDNGPWIQVSSTFNHTCAINHSNDLFCWGWNKYGQIGDGTYDKKSSPVRIGKEKKWYMISAGTVSTCGITIENEMFCWGSEAAEHNEEKKAAQSKPIIIGGFTKWVFVSTGSFYTCAIDSNSKLYCWGSGTYKNKLVQIGADSDWLTVDNYSEHACAIKKDGRLYCWGENGKGILGKGTHRKKVKPNQVGKDSDWIDVSAGTDKTCAVKKDGKLYCWGMIYCGKCGQYLEPQLIMQL
jgi:alpha-tubulin suppressor-like RCC1 family protein